MNKIWFWMNTVLGAQSSSETRRAETTEKMRDATTKTWQCLSSHVNGTIQMLSTAQQMEHDPPSPGVIIGQRGKSAWKSYSASQLYTNYALM